MAPKIRPIWQYYGGGVGVPYCSTQTVSEYGLKFDEIVRCGIKKRQRKKWKMF